MAPPARKRVKREAEVPVEPESVPCYDFRTGFKTEPSEPEDVPQDAGQNAVTDNNEGASSSSGTFTEDVGNEFQNMLQGLEGDIREVFRTKRKKFEMDTKAFSKNIIHIIGQAVENQQEERQELFLKYSQQFRTLFQALDADVRKTKEEEANLGILLHEHRKLFYQSRVAQKQRMKSFLQLYNNFIKSMEDLDEVHEYVFTKKDSSLRQEMAEMGNNIMKEAKQYDLAIIETILRSLVL
ncbi:hypothetical protein mRhiFer1_016442 [Rhinolophus ferrumequinum]|uniref:XLR/SYCP3/FAM9 domain-containing protein n=1 Tax=Rhinolophus ferrumequinum TaxID=59479 RepID=A0A7J8AWI7_RHIFE|nr:hypothetical protein mRhiFer1_016442 [Rhinolophus ferrumequinum]